MKLHEQRFYERSIGENTCIGLSYSFFFFEGEVPFFLLNYSEKDELVAWFICLFLFFSFPFLWYVRDVTWCASPPKYVTGNQLVQKKNEQGTKQT